jgi:hydrogenase maturation protease
VIEQHDKVLFVDAVDAGERPGAIVVLEGDTILSFLNTQRSAHHIGLVDLLFAAKLTGSPPAEVCLVGIQPKLIDIGIELTDVLQERLDVFMATVMEQLGKWDAELRFLYGL